RSSDLRRWLDGLAGVAFRWRGLSFVLRRRLVIFGRWALRVIAILIPKDGLRTVHICRIRSLTLGVNHRIRRQEWIIGVVRGSSLRRGRILLRALILIRVRSEERRVGKEWRCQMWPDAQKTNTKIAA